MGETLRTDTSDIEDANGLANATFSYRWVSSDGTTDTDIEKATDSTYKLVAANQGKSIKVIVTFADDTGNEETLTSAPAGPVLREPVLGDGPPGAPRNLTITAGDREVTLSWEPPEDNGNPPATRYRIERRMDGKDYNKSHWGIARKTTYTKTHLANGVTYIFRVKAENGSGNDLRTIRTALGGGERYPHVRLGRGPGHAGAVEHEDPASRDGAGWTGRT